MNGEEILVPIFICVVLPVLIVWLVTRVRKNETDKRAEIIIKAIESGQQVNPNLLSPQNSPKSLKEKLLSRLTAACITFLIGIAILVPGIIISQKVNWNFAASPFPMFVLISGILIAIGVALFIIYMTGKKMLSKEIEAEENNLSKTDKTK